MFGYPAQEWVALGLICVVCGSILMACVVVGGRSERH